MPGLSAGQEAEDWLKAAIQAEHAKTQAMLAEVKQRLADARAEAEKCGGVYRNYLVYEMKSLHAALLKIAGGE